MDVNQHRRLAYLASQSLDLVAEIGSMGMILKGVFPYLEEMQIYTFSEQFYSDIHDEEFRARQISFNMHTFIDDCIAADINGIIPLNHAAEQAAKDRGLVLIGEGIPEQQEGYCARIFWIN